MRIPFQNYFYDIGIFYTTYINFNLFDVKPIYKHGSSPSDDVNINMYKNIEASDFCMNYLSTKLENNRPSKYIGIKEEYQNDIVCDFVETIQMSSTNILRVYMFTLNEYTDTYRYILVERKNIPKIEEHTINTLSAVQIATSDVLNYLKKIYHKENNI
jgi:hypothetical protein